ASLEPEILKIHQNHLRLSRAKPCQQSAQHFAWGRFQALQKSLRSQKSDECRFYPFALISHRTQFFAWQQSHPDALHDIVSTPMRGEGRRIVSVQARDAEGGRRTQRGFWISPCFELHDKHF